MSTQALYDYQGEPRDKLENFHGNQVVYFCWDRHLMFCSPVALPLSPETPFRTLVDEVLPGIYNTHPDWPHVDWEAVEWSLDQEPFAPDMERSLVDQGIGHKSLIRFNTPGLDGIAGSCS